MNEESDMRLLEKCQAGDTRALESLLERHRDQIYRFAFKMCGDREDASDVLQETMLAIARNIRSFRGESSLSTWLYRIAHSFCIKHRRKEPSRIDGDNAARAAREMAPPPDRVLGQRELQEKLASALHELDPMYREVLVLRDMEGLSAPEVSDVLGVSVQAVKSRLHRARSAMRESLASYVEAGESREPIAAGCPDVLSEFSRMLEGELTPDICREMEQHVSACPQCKQRCDSLKETLALCRATPNIEVPQEVADSIRVALRELGVSR